MTLVSPRVSARASPGVSPGVAGEAKKVPGISDILAPVAATWVGWWSTYDPALPADPGITLATGVSTWRDQRNNYPLAQATAAMQPGYAVDGSFFGGRKAVQLAIAGTKFLQGDFGAPIFAASTGPWILIVARNRVAPAADGRLLEISNGLTARAVPFIWTASNQSVSGTPALALAANSLDQSVHIYEWNGAVAGASLTTTPGSSVSGGSGALNGIVDRFTLGAFRNGAANYIDGSVVEIIALTVYPGATIASQLIAALMSKWLIAQRPPLPANTIEYWQSEFGASASQTIGQKAGSILTGQNSTAVAVDPGYFNNRPVFKADNATQSNWWGEFASIQAAGAQPWLYIVARQTLGMGVLQRRIGGVGHGTPAADYLEVGILSTGVRVASGACLPNGEASLEIGSQDTAVHRY